MSEHRIMLGTTNETLVKDIKVMLTFVPDDAVVRSVGTANLPEGTFWALWYETKDED